MASSDRALGGLLTAEFGPGIRYSTTIQSREAAKGDTGRGCHHSGRRDSVRVEAEHYGFPAQRIQTGRKVGMTKFCMTKVGLALVVACSTAGVASPAVAQSLAHQHGPALSASTALRQDMRKLWSDHVIWTRAY